MGQLLFHLQPLLERLSDTGPVTMEQLPIILNHYNRSQEKHRGVLCWFPPTLRASGCSCLLSNVFGFQEVQRAEIELSHS